MIKHSLFLVAMLALLLVFGGFATVFVSCDNGTTNNSNGAPSSMAEILRVDQEVRDLFFYDGDGNGIPDSIGDTGSVGGVCSDYAAEFYYRYTGKVYLVAINNYGSTTWCTAEWLPFNTFNWRTKKDFGLNTTFYGIGIGAIGEYDGVLRDAYETVVSTETWTESTHKNAVFHKWCVAVADGRWYLVDPTWRDSSPDRNPIMEIPVPNWAHRSTGDGGGSRATKNDEVHNYWPFNKQ